jgi:predicted N-acetyltransferase YhbS
MLIRHENLIDNPDLERNAIYNVVATAFGRESEARLVNELRSSGAAATSLVAEIEHKIVAHIMFSRAYVQDIPILALAPVATLPEYRHKGIASELIRKGIEESYNNKEIIITVLGNEFYKKFGFEESSKVGLFCPYDFPSENFLTLFLNSSFRKKIQGVVTYPPEFDRL